jgi:hypothetical protein
VLTILIYWIYNAANERVCLLWDAQAQAALWRLTSSSAAAATRGQAMPSQAASLLMCPALHVQVRLPKNEWSENLLHISPFPMPWFCSQRLSNPQHILPVWTKMEVSHILCHLFILLFSGMHLYSIELNECSYTHTPNKTSQIYMVLKHQITFLL